MNQNSNNINTEIFGVKISFQPIQPSTTISTNSTTTFQPSVSKSTSTKKINKHG